jgi:hypothetical protein
VQPLVLELTQRAAEASRVARALQRDGAGDGDGRLGAHRHKQQVVFEPAPVPGDEPLPVRVHGPNPGQVHGRVVLAGDLHEVVAVGDTDPKWLGHRERAVGERRPRRDELELHALLGHVAQRQHRVVRGHPPPTMVTLRRSFLMTWSVAPVRRAGVGSCSAP